MRLTFLFPASLLCDTMTSIGAKRMIDELPSGHVITLAGLKVETKSFSYRSFEIRTARIAKVVADVFELARRGRKILSE